MKKIVLFSIAVTTLSAVFAQSEKYMKAMQTNVSALDSLHTVDAWTDMTNTFQRIAEVEKTQWLPYYYAALSHVMSGLMMGQGQMGGIADKVDPVADKAEELIIKAEALGKENSEIYCVKKLIATLRMMGDPMTRWQTQGPIATEALNRARALNPQNPRVYLLEAQDKFYTPEQFGGSKTEAKALFEESLKKYESFKPESDIHPNWGKSQAQYFLSQLK